MIGEIFWGRYLYYKIYTVKIFIKKKLLFILGCDIFNERLYYDILQITIRISYLLLLL